MLTPKGGKTLKEVVEQLCGNDSKQSTLKYYLKRTLQSKKAAKEIIMPHQNRVMKDGFVTIVFNHNVIRAFNELNGKTCSTQDANGRAAFEVFD